MTLGAITLLIIREGLFLGVLGSPAPGHEGPPESPQGTVTPQLLKTEWIVQTVRLYGNYGCSKDSGFVP